MKKIIAFLLSLILLFQLSIPAVAMAFPGSVETEKAENVNTIMGEELIELREPNFFSASGNTTGSRRSTGKVTAFFSSTVGFEII